MDYPWNPTYENTKRILPVVQEAEDRYWAAVRDVTSEAEYEELTKTFNKVLDKAIDALYEDTKDRNQKSTLEQVYKARGKFDTHFGIRPTLHIMELIRYEQTDVEKESATN